MSLCGLSDAYLSVQGKSRTICEPELSKNSNTLRFKYILRLRLSFATSSSTPSVIVSILRILVYDRTECGPSHTWGYRSALAKLRHGIKPRQAGTASPVKRYNHGIRTSKSNRKLFASSYTSLQNCSQNSGRVKSETVGTAREQATAKAVQPYLATGISVLHTRHGRYPPHMASPARPPE